MNLSTAFRTAGSSPRKVVVGIAEIAVVTEPSVEIWTYALGSCLGLAIYDPVSRVGGLLHAMLPASTVATQKADENPAMFVDTGVPELFKACYRAGAVKSRLLVFAAGCANMSQSQSSDIFQIGRRNMVMLRKLLWKNGVLLTRHDTEGNDSRTMALSLDSGRVHISVRGEQRVL
jgi:chemotaxis protein CheD